MGSRAPVGWLIGVLSAGVALGVGELVAVFVRAAAAPLIAVGNGIIVLTPESWKRPTIDSVGTNDKPLLIVGVLLIVAVFGAAVGSLALRHLSAALCGVALLGGVGVFCALIAKGSRGSDVVPTIVGTIASAAVLVVLVRLAGGPAVDKAGGPADDKAGGPADDQAGGPADDQAPAAGALPDRRIFILGSAAVAALASAAGFGGRAAQHARFDVAADRGRIRLPKATGDDASPVGVDLGKSGIPWATPNGDFYRIDTALTVPQIAAHDWQLHIHGMVDREITLTFDELRARPMINRWITLCCVSNPVGGNLVGNALFRGTRLADLMREAGLRPDADQLLLGSYDGYTFGAPAAVVMDGRDALLAIGMNGEPLPIEHGFPARTVVPGLYGYVSACKWIVDIKVTTFAAEQAYWVQGGWAPAPPIQLASRIDTPRSHAVVQVGKQIAIAGVALDQHVGVSKVEVQIDDRPWQRAQVAAVPSTDTWRQWYLAWTPDSAGEHILRVRAVDGRGRPQAVRHRSAFPSGATGLDTITVQAAS